VYNIIIVFKMGVRKLKIKILAFGVAALLLLSVATVATARQTKDEARKTFSLPSSAVQVSSNVYYLGKARDVDGKEVEGFAFVRRKENTAKPAKPPKPGGPACYGYLANGAKWKNFEPWVVNPDTSYLQKNFVYSNLGINIGKWESAAGKNILGDGSMTGEVLVADTVSPDGQNEVYFADVVDGDTIAVTIVWGYFGGPPQTRKLVEWDQVYDDNDYSWSDSGEPDKMDFENIATHELGHSFGMDDIYDSACSDVTMYGYADFGETKKRTLEAPDITGVFNLYK